MEAFQLPLGRRHADPSMEPLPPWLATTAPHYLPIQARYVAPQLTAKAFCVVGTTRLGLPTARGALAASLFSVVTACAKPLCHHPLARRSDQPTSSSSPSNSENDSHGAPDYNNHPSTQNPYLTSSGLPSMSSFPLCLQSLPMHSARKNGCPFPTPMAQT